MIKYAQPAFEFFLIIILIIIFVILPTWGLVAFFNSILPKPEISISLNYNGKVCNTQGQCITITPPNLDGLQD